MVYYYFCNINYCIVIHMLYYRYGRNLFTMKFLNADIVALLFCSNNVGHIMKNCRSKNEM